jgi:predicted SnoaL-like aldol condensation-catalyzing enzyme
MKPIIAFALLSCSLVSVSFGATPSQQDKNKAVAKRVFDEIFNESRFQTANEIYAQDFVNHGLHRNADLAEDQAAVRWEKQVAPDLKITADLMVAVGDLVTVVWTARGTNSVASGWVPATGVKIEERGITVWRIVDGRIREEWTSFDSLRIVREIISQLKWTLMGLALAAVILVWLVIWFVRKLWHTHGAGSPGL